MGPAAGRDRASTGQHEPDGILPPWRGPSSTSESRTWGGPQIHAGFFFPDDLQKHPYPAYDVGEYDCTGHGQGAEQREESQSKRGRGQEQPHIVRGYDPGYGRMGSAGQRAVGEQDPLGGAGAARCVGQGRRRTWLDRVRCQPRGGWAWGWLPEGIQCQHRYSSRQHLGPLGHYRRRVGIRQERYGFYGMGSGL